MGSKALRGSVPHLKNVKSWCGSVSWRVHSGPGGTQQRVAVVTLLSGTVRARTRVCETAQSRLWVLLLLSPWMPVCFCTMETQSLVSHGPLGEGRTPQKQKAHSGEGDCLKGPRRKGSWMFSGDISIQPRQPDKSPFPALGIFLSQEPRPFV